MLAVELLPRAREYEEVLRHLLEHGADPRARSAVGWSAIDEAVSRGDERLVRALFDHTQQGLRLRWEERLGCVRKSLQLLPDFECRIRWEFESPVLPLFNKIAPSDIIRLRKSGTSFRLDSTLASWKRFRLSKRRELSTIFQGGASEHGGSSSSSGPRLWQLNHSKKTATDMTENLDAEEAGAVVDDLVQGEAVQWDMQVNHLEVAEGTTWLGQVAAPCDVNGWNAHRYEVRGSLGVAVRKKGTRPSCTTFEDYFGCPLPADACLPQFRREFDSCSSPSMLSRENSRGSGWSEYTDLSGFPVHDRDGDSVSSEVLTRWPDVASPSCDSISSPKHARCDSNSFHSLAKRQSLSECTPSETSSGSHSPSNGGNGRSWRRASFFRRPSTKKQAGDKVGKKEHRVSASVWLANDFAIPLEHFLPILETLSAEHEAMRRLKDFLNSQSLQDAAERAQAAQGSARASGEIGDTGYIFPVKASVPLNLAVRALVHFELFDLKEPGSFSPDLFEVPDGYSSVRRKEAQKTLNHSKKRMLLAHLAM
jgi:hypothetical protein